MTPKSFTFDRIVADSITGSIADSITDFLIDLVFFLKASSHRNDYERIQLKTDLRLVNIIRSEGKPFHICLKNMFSNYFVK